MAFHVADNCKGIDLTRIQLDTHLTFAAVGAAAGQQKKTDWKFLRFHL